MIFLSKFKSHSVTRNAVALTLLQAANYLVPLAVLPFLTRNLGVDEFGKVAVVLAIIQFAFVLTDYGFTLSATYFISLNRDSVSKVSKKISVLFAAKSLILLVIICLVVLIAAVSQISAHERVVAAAMLLAITAQAFQPMWLFQGIERMRDYTVYVVLSKVFYAASVFSLVSAPADSTWVIISWASAQVLAMIISLCLMFRLGYKFLPVSFHEVQAEFRNGLQYFLSRLSVFVYSSANVVFLSSQGAAQAAYFSVCDQIYKAGQSFTAPVNAAMYPYMAKDKNWSLFYKIFFVGVLVLILGCLVLGLNAELLLRILFGEEFAAGADALVLLLIATVINYVGVTFGYSAYAALNRTDIANCSVIFGAVLHLIMLAIGFYNDSLSAYTVAFMVCITEFSVALFRVVGVCILRRAKTTCEAE